jgi:ribosomal protein S18 acetylase RimI-like enzyme
VSSIAIREAGAGDAAIIVAIHETAVLGEQGRGWYADEQLEAWSRRAPVSKLSSQHGARRFFLLSEGQAVLAYAQLDVERGILRSLYVLPQHQRRGVGLRLARALLAEAESAGLVHLELDASLNSVAFYEALGFARLGAANHSLADGVTLPCEHMGLDLAQVIPGRGAPKRPPDTGGST